MFITENTLINIENLNTNCNFPLRLLLLHHSLELIFYSLNSFIDAGIPVWIGRKLHTRYRLSSKHKRNCAVLGGVAASVCILNIYWRIICMHAFVGGESANHKTSHSNVWQNCELENNIKQLRGICLLSFILTNIVYKQWTITVKRAAVEKMWQDISVCQWMNHSKSRQITWYCSAVRLPPDKIIPLEIHRCYRYQS